MFQTVLFEQSVLFSDPESTGNENTQIHTVITSFSNTVKQMTYININKVRIAQTVVCLQNDDNYNTTGVLIEMQVIKQQNR